MEAAVGRQRVGEAVRAGLEEQGAGGGQGDQQCRDGRGEKSESKKFSVFPAGPALGWQSKNFYVNRLPLIVHLGVNGKGRGPIY